MSQENQDVYEGRSLEDQIFKTLSHQKRRDILRVIGERGEVTFTEIKNSVGIEDSPSLSYHINALGQLVVQKEGKYRLSDLGRDTYNLICKASTYSVSSSIVGSLRREIPLVIVANAVLWAAALFSVSAFEGRPSTTTVYSFAALWFFSNMILYSIARRIRK